MADLISLVSDVGDLSQMNPDTILKLTDRGSHSMLDVSNLTKSSHLSLSTPSLVGGGMWSKLTKKSAEFTDSKTNLLRSADGLDNCSNVGIDSVSLVEKEKDKKKKLLSPLKSVTKTGGNKLSPKMERKKVPSKVALMKVSLNC